jgi:hypothetical protein
VKGGFFVVLLCFVLWRGCGSGALMGDDASCGLHGMGSRVGAPRRISIRGGLAFHL